MPENPAVKRIVGAASLIAACLSIVIFLVFPPDISKGWLIAFATFLSLALFSGRFALRRTEGGTTTSLDFVPQLGALIVVGPAGAVALTVVSELTSQFGFQDKPAVRALYNTAQLVIAVVLASVAYTLLGGQSHQTQFPLQALLLPFIGAVLAYFLVNSTAVSYIIAVSEGLAVEEVLRRLAGGVGIILLDAAMSLLALLVAFLYVEWGPVALLVAIIPIIGLRYSYGVNIELEQLNADLLRVLIKALEARDPYTSGHSVRVAERAKLIAKELGLSRPQLRNVEIAALLHDIGKIDAAYQKILKQEGPLSENQRKLIHEHPERGVEIVESVRSLDDEVLDCIRHHHERYDGNGYPEGISGETIPIGARIIMVSDTIDAMLTKRSYRDALPLSVVREELEAQKGSQFDPKVVRAAFSAGILRDEFNEELVEVSRSFHLSA